MVSVALREGISETLDILNHMDRTYTDKIPKKFRDFLEQNQLEHYQSQLDHTQSLSEMNLQEKTKDILAVLYMNYWCNPQEKKDYIRLLNDNERKYQAWIREKYNPDNLFPKREPEPVQKAEEAKLDVAMVAYQETIFQRLWQKIKSFWKR